ncbi:site-specific integrase [Streptomyces millisiae]|uniref:Tyrosine-type recombinase/integrase n=1 Tax=Streptomyces millisiae TaxID=3075542 RepID=A0ABU2LM45_9ACTN|nr:tyrosine-type recombinase/integrase [Streptomyces sp. DSM 44918]MDT0318575.1 tyrosine-type recombinase/integrase [Streptomyces sp. DSM 44918]
MTTEEPYDRWHKARPREGEPECPEHPGLVPSSDHGCEKRWQARWRDRNGQQRSKNFPKNKKTAAAAYQRSQRAAVDEGRDPLPHRGQRKKSATPTIAEYTETFLSRHEGRPGTVDTYRYRLRGHVIPVLGERRIDTVKRGEYRDFLAALKSGGMPDSTRSGVKKSLSALLSMAVEDGYMEGNPVAGIRLPKAKNREIRLTWKHVVALAEEIYPRYEMMIWYGALQALRSMEAAGVRRSDMETARGKQLVEEQRQRGRAAPLKTEASTAFLPVGSFLLDKYVAHVARWRAPLSEGALRKRERRGLAPLRAEYDDLVTVTRYGTPVRENALCRAFNQAKERVRARGIMIPEGATFRDLRHFVDAVLVASGLEPRKVQARMRHARLGETLDTYGYLIWDVDWENAPASFEELYGIPAPPGLPEAALVPRAERETAAR